MAVESQNPNIPPVMDKQNTGTPYQAGMMPYWSQPMQEDEIDLQKIWQTIWSGKKIIAGVTLVVAFVAAIVSVFLPNIYKSEVLLVPAAQEDAGSLSGLVGQFGGLANLAGISLGGSGVDKTTMALEVLKSRVFVASFLHKYQLEVPLMAASGWDEESQTWIIDESDYDTTNKKWIRDVKSPYKPEPSDLELHEEFTKHIMNASLDAKTGLVKISVSLFSPEESARWSTLLVKELNEKMRSLDVTEAEKSIEFLNKQLEKTSLSDMQQIFYQLIEQQTKTIMLANVRDEYVFKTIDPAIVPEEKSKPKRVLIVAVFSVLGMIMSVFYVLIFRKKV